MPKPSWENLDEFLGLDEFATTATIQHRDGTERTVKCIHDDPYINPKLGEYEADTVNPSISCGEAELAGVRRGDVVLVDGKTYDVLTGPQSDGTGWAMLQLAAR